MSSITGSIKTLLGLLLYRIAPIHSDRFVFTSFNGHYSDNTKSISEKLHTIRPGAEIVWLLLPEHDGDAPDDVKHVPYDSLKAYWYRGTACAQIDNCYGFRANFLQSKSKFAKWKYQIFNALSDKSGQPIFATEHGTAFKKCGRDQIGNTMYDCSARNTYIVTGNRFTEDILRYITFDRCTMHSVGWPRNDILFQKRDGTERERMGLPKDKKLLLYAPTFRNDGKDTEGKNIERSGLNQLQSMDFDRLFATLSEAFGGEWAMICRFHYHVAKMVDWKSLEKRYPGRFINGNLHDDMAEYLVCADAMLTDASSCMFDFMNTGRPCFLYFPDMVHYRDRERGLYIDLSELPFPLAEDFETLLEHIHSFDAAAYDTAWRTFGKRLDILDDGHASERFIAYMMEHCKA